MGASTRLAPPAILRNRLFRRCGAAYGWPVASGYELVVADRLIRVVFRGPQDFQTTEDAIVEGSKLVKEKGLVCVLFDFRFADPNGYFSEVVRHAERAERLGLSRDLRIAFFSPTQGELMDFMATVAVNRGWTARAFRDEAQALKWLNASGAQAAAPPGQ